MQSTQRRRPMFGRVARIIGYGALCAAALGAGTVAGWIGQSSFAKEILRQDTFNTRPQEIWAGRDSITLLILGCDEDRYYGGKQILKEKARSDMMLVTKLDFARGQITGISIPRDTLAAPRGYRLQKINSYHVLGGPRLSKAAVEALLPGVSIDRVVVLDFKALEKMVDMVGGVELYVPKEMKYTDKRGGLYIDLKPGRQRLDGYAAVGFVRYRKGDDDFHRQDRQKEFMLAFKDAAMGNPGLLPRVAQQARLVLGGAMDDREVASLALFARSVGSANISMGTLPTVAARGFNLRVDRSKLRRTLKSYRLVEQPSMRVSLAR